MIKFVIPYTNYMGVKKEKECRFNMTRSECVDLDLEYEEYGGLKNYLQGLMKNYTGKDQEEFDKMPKKPIIDFFKMLVDRSYGILSEDGDLFRKKNSEGVPYINDFRDSPAYSEFVYGLLDGTYDIEEFVKGALPYVSDEAIQKARAELQTNNVTPIN